MNIKKILSVTKFKIKKNSPAIFTVLGIAGLVGAGVMDCVATKKIEESENKKDYKELKERSKEINKTIENNKRELGANKHNFSEEKIVEIENEIKEQETELRKLDIEAKVKYYSFILLSYAPSIILGGISILSILQGQKILKNRNAMLGSAYIALDESYKKFVKKTKEVIGEDKFDEIMHDVKTEIKQTTTKDENGKKVKNEVVTKKLGLDNISPYAKYFNSDSAYFQKDMNYNLLFLKKQEQYANELLRAEGYVFLNTVYEMLDLPKTAAGQQVGWMISNKEDHPGDNYIDFGLYVNNRNEDFINCKSDYALLDFNVDGVIFDKITYKNLKGNE